jgi:hypothetical protein
MTSKEKDQKIRALWYVLNHDKWETNHLIYSYEYRKFAKITEP